jgi:dUTP pyrophosphatase
MLNREELEELILKNNLITGYIDLKSQLTPNGFDLTVEKVFEFEEAGALDFSNKERQMPQVKEILAQKRKQDDKFGWWQLNKGIYKLRSNETVNLTCDLMALAFSRTSLLRMGAFTQHGVWDAGFQGRSEFVLVVDNPAGIRIKQNARVAQMVFLRINQTGEGYNGIYQNLK